MMATRALRRRGFALVLVVWMVVLLTILAYSLLNSTTIETRLASTRRKMTEADALARAGVARAIVDLRNDLVFDYADEGRVFDAEGDVWARPEEGKLDEELGRGTFTTIVTDLNGYFDINRMNAVNRPILERIIQDVGYNEDDAKLTAAAIVDWLDADTVPSVPGAQGEEGTYYAMLMAEDDGVRVKEEDVTPIKLANEPFQTVDQLLGVYGVTPELFFGPDSPEAEYFSGGEPVARGSQQRGKRFQIDARSRPRRGETKPGLRDYFTTRNLGSLNINTAPKHVLASYLSLGGSRDGEQVAETIVRKRRGGRDEDIDNDSAYQTMDDINRDSELAGALAGVVQLYPVGLRSEHFRITSTGRVGEVQKRIVVDVNRQLVNLLRDEKFEVADRARERARARGERSRRRADQQQENITRYPAVRIEAWRE